MSSINTVRVTLKIRNDTAAEWAKNNPILQEGEFGLDTTNLLFKIGDGVTPWNNLLFLNKFDESKLIHSQDGTITLSDSFLQELSQYVTTDGNPITAGNIITVNNVGQLTDSGIPITNSGALIPGSSENLGGVKSSNQPNFIRITVDNDITGSTAGFMTLNQVSTSLLYVPNGDKLILNGGNSAEGD